MSYSVVVNPANSQPIVLPYFGTLSDYSALRVVVTKSDGSTTQITPVASGNNANLTLPANTLGRYVLYGTKNAVEKYLQGGYFYTSIVVANGSVSSEVAALKGTAKTVSNLPVASGSGQVQIATDLAGGTSYLDDPTLFSRVQMGAPVNASFGGRELAAPDTLTNGMTLSGTPGNWQDVPHGATNTGNLSLSVGAQTDPYYLTLTGAVAIATSAGNSSIGTVIFSLRIVDMAGTVQYGGSDFYVNVLPVASTVLASTVFLRTRIPAGAPARGYKVQVRAVASAGTGFTYYVIGGAGTGATGSATTPVIQGPTEFSAHSVV